MYIHIGHNRMHNLSKSSFQTENINKSFFLFVCLFLNSQLCTFLQSFFKYSSGWQVISLHRTIRILLHSQSSSFFFIFVFNNKILFPPSGLQLHMLGKSPWLCLCFNKGHSCMAHKEFFLLFYLLKKKKQNKTPVQSLALCSRRLCFACYTQNTILSDFFWPQLSIKVAEILKQYRNSNVHFSHFTGFVVDL